MAVVHRHGHLDGARASDRRSFLRVSGAAAAALALGGSLAGCSSKSNVAGAGTQDSASGKLVALVNTQAPGDNGPIDEMISALHQLGADKGVRTRELYEPDASTYETTLRNLAQSGVAVVITNFNNMDGPLKAVAPQFPNVKFIQLYGDPVTPSIPNLVTVSYDYYVGCYLSGVLAAKISATGKVGYIGGSSVPGINADLNGFAAGARSVNPAISVSSAFVGSFQDPAKALQVAAQMYGSGVDYIQTDAAASDTGIINAAAQGTNRVVSGGSVAQFAVGPTTVASVVNLDFGKSLYQEAAKALGGSFNGGAIKSGLSDGVVDLVYSDKFPSSGPAQVETKIASAKTFVEDVKQKILSGSITVPYKTSI